MMPWKPWHVTDGSALDSRCAALLRDHQADLFLTGSAGSDGNAWHYLGLFPRDEFAAKSLLHREALKDWLDQSNLPALGLMSYTLGFQGTGRFVRRDPTDPPALIFRRYEALVRWDTRTQLLEGAFSSKQAQRRAHQLLDELPTGSPPPLPRSTDVPNRVHASCSQAEYVAAVEECIRRIEAGDFYQLNLTMAFDSPCAAPELTDWFLGLLRTYPAEFYGAFHLPNHVVYSTSPELFLRMRNGEVITRPIKGTRTCTPETVELEADRLRSSPKEQAELSMIVDLLRNDISYHCAVGSVQVPRHLEVFEVDGLLQMFAEVRGRLRRDRHGIDLLLDAFPGGSITGCPKRSAMETISQLETHSRGPYCGSFVVYHSARDLDTNILIRTAVLDRIAQRLRFYAGSGIVVESDPQSEYIETVSKVAKFLRHLP